MLKIGSYEVPTNVLLAPLAGCSDLAFRLIAREHGAKFCFLEMVDTNAVVYGPKFKTRSILKTHRLDAPIAAQLLGREPSMMLKAAREIMELVEISFLDINAACPAKKAIKKKTGSYLLQDGKTLHEIIKALAAALPVPVTVKIRTGYDTVDMKSLTKLVKGCESSGASAIFVHGRTRTQGYAGNIDYAAIKAVKESVKIPVIGSGNIFDAGLAKRMFAETGCDSISVARGALGNPWIFREIENYMSNPSSSVSSRTGLNLSYCLAERMRVLKRHLSYIDKYKECSPSGKTGFMRKVVLWYLRGFHNAPRLRGQISVVNSYEKMLNLLDTIEWGPIAIKI